MTDNKDLIKALSLKLPDEAIQRTRGNETKKGYDTTGYGYMYAIDRFNEVLGTEWGYDWKIIHEEQGKYRDKEYNGKTIPGASYWELTVEVSIWIQDKKSRSCIGGHTAVSYADALKGAITNGFKKTAAFWGVGRDAFAGTIDDDNQPLPDSAENKVKNAFNGTDVTDIVTQDNINKLTALSEKIKEGLRIVSNKVTKKAIQICIDNEWNESKIEEYLKGELK